MPKTFPKTVKRKIRSDCPSNRAKYVVTEYFLKTFYKNKQAIRAVPQTKMTIRFTADEIRNIIAKVKADKSAG